MRSTIYKIGRRGGPIILGVCLAGVYLVLDPAENAYFPACPFRSLTGLECPGCGSQRAVHHLLNFRFLEAVRQNALLVGAIPYVLIGLYCDRYAKPSATNECRRKRFFGRTAMYLALLVIVGYWVLRNF